MASSPPRTADPTTTGVQQAELVLPFRMLDPRVYRLPLAHKEAGDIEEPTVERSLSGRHAVPPLARTEGHCGLPRRCVDWVAVPRSASDDEGECGMWAQLITTRVKQGSEEGLQRLFQQLREAKQPDSGPVRTLVMREQQDPNTVSMLVVFESEEKARARESDPRRDKALAAARTQWRRSSTVRRRSPTSSWSRSKRRRE